MAHREQFHNNIFVVFISVLFSGCYFTVPKEIPQTKYVIVEASNTELKQVADNLFYRDSLFTGTLYALYQNEDTAFVFHYAKGKQEGSQEKWYPNHQQAELRFYTEGRKTGTHYGWWENGRLKFRYSFSDDEHNGELKEWFENGSLARSFHYNNGYEEGNQRMWWPDGSVRANYDVREGKRYGLTGEKLCSNKINNAKN